jgi:hypothetical protein
MWLGHHCSSSVAAIRRSQRRESLQLERGVHAILIKYFQAGSDLDLRVSRRRGDGSLEPIPAWALTPKRPSFGRFAAEAMMERSLAALEWLWLGIVVIVIAVASWPASGELLPRFAVMPCGVPSLP